jgi:hypothetical protein
MELSKKFEKGIDTHTYQRIDPDYKVNIFLGYNDDGQMSMILTENGKEEKVLSSKLIDVHLNRREDHKLALSFDLLDFAYAPMFTVFCKDMIVVCERAGKDMAISSAIVRWKYWKEMFGKKRSHLLDKQEIKGLMGELYALKNIMITKYGCKDAIKSWRGPLYGHKDFEIDRTWYEVKTINDGAVQVIISSLEQLESDIDGHLILVRVDETSENNEKASNLNKIVLQITDMIEDPEILEEFRMKLDNAGYSADQEYDSINYIFKGSEMYMVNDSFPRLRRSTVSDSIGNAKYTILLAGITGFKE